MTVDFLYDFIRQHRFAVAATVSGDHRPESACVGIAVTQDLKLIFDTRSDSRKYKNLAQNPGIAFVIGWENGQTIQYEGTAINFGKNERLDLLETYFEVFPDGSDRKENWENITYFCIEPTWIRFSDFNKLPPLIEEIKF